MLRQWLTARSNIAGHIPMEGSSPRLSFYCHRKLRCHHRVDEHEEMYLFSIKSLIISCDEQVTRLTTTVRYCRSSSFFTTMSPNAKRGQRSIMFKISLHELDSDSIGKVVQHNGECSVVCLVGPPLPLFPLQCHPNSCIASPKLSSPRRRVMHTMDLHHQTQRQ